MQPLVWGAWPFMCHDPRHRGGEPRLSTACRARTGRPQRTPELGERCCAGPEGHRLDSVIPRFPAPGSAQLSCGGQSNGGSGSCGGGGGGTSGRRGAP